ncbi:type VI secretion system amidase effector protein Tae4 [Burkholderia ubonensis]|uniref:type VI secretion system amidase effector protein Tae4 n=1 Tax=Burkholderia ubonensis TaxID=101571 RepID=UPI001E31D5D3|nr:type VI secretion system amidase effector protein Tae4 [Burkholderia ubonensis]
MNYRHWSIIVFDASRFSQTRNQGWRMTRPGFTAAWAASQRIYDAKDPGAKVANVIGGYVEKNINNPDPKQRWSNTCAVRMSYILNHAELIIPAIRGQTVSGADSRTCKT